MRCALRSTSGALARIRTHRLDGNQGIQIGEDAWNLGLDPVAQRHAPSLRWRRFASGQPWRQGWCPCQASRIALKRQRELADHLEAWRPPRS